MRRVGGAFARGAPSRLFSARAVCFLIAALFAPRTAFASLLVDDFEDGGATNAFGGPWVTATAGGSTTSGFSAVSPGDASSTAGYFDYTMASGVPSGYVILETFLLPSASTAGIDLSGYEGVRFAAKGSGTFLVALPTTATAPGPNFFAAYFSTPTDWTEVQIPFSVLAQPYGNTATWDPTTVYAVVWAGLDRPGASGALSIDDVEFYPAAEAPPALVNNPILAAPKVNQVGYLPASKKAFHVTLGAAAQPGGPFAVLDATTMQTVLRGTLAPAAFDDTASSGESVLLGDFSSLTQPGTYVVSVGGALSPAFAVGDDLYTPLFRDAIRAFSILRCGVAIDDTETGIQHPACHTADAALLDDPSQSRDLTGGWHNAGDFGKWTHEAAISASYMMWLYEIRGSAIGAIDTNIPESGNDVPDVLDEARWGLEWMLKMQLSDGSVMHKVDTQPNFAWGLSPDLDPYTRRAGLASTIDAADFTAVMAQASRVFAPFDPTFAATCMAAARQAWTWVQANPNVAETDIYYPDPDPTQEVTWALGEMVRATHDPALVQQFVNAVQATALTAVTWQTPELLGYLTVALDSGADAGARAQVLGAMTNLAQGLAASAAATGYGVALEPAEYVWESNETLVHRAAALVFASVATGDDSYRQLALEQLDWLLGDNGLGRSFVTGFGSTPIAHPYHWTAYALGRLLPGWGGGGPNQDSEGADLPLLQVIAEQTPPAKSYLDMGNAVGSYASNEGEISENAALAFVAGAFVPGSAPPASDRGCQTAKAWGDSRVGWMGALVLVAVAARRRRPSRSAH